MRKFFRKALHHVRGLKKKRLEREAALKAANARPSHRMTRREAEVSEHVFMMRALRILFLITLFAFGAFVLYRGSSIVFMFIVSFLIASALDPLATRLQKNNKIPKSVTILGIYLLFFLFLILFGTRIVPILTEQLKVLIAKIGTFFAGLQSYDPQTFPIEFLRPGIAELLNSLQPANIQAQLQDVLQVVADELFSLRDNVWQIFKGISESLMNFLLVLLIAYLMIIERANLNNFLVNIIPSKYASYTMKNLDNIREKMGSWLFGRFLLSVGVGFLTYLVLLILGIPSAATLGIMMGIFDIVPIIGPAVAWLFILPVALNISFFTAVWMTVGVLAVQWFENNVMIPYIMKKAMGIPSLTIIFSLIIGWHFFQVVGLILAVPVAAMVALFWNDYVRRH